MATIFVTPDQDTIVSEIDMAEPAGLFRLCRRLAGVLQEIKKFAEQ